MKTLAVDTSSKACSCALLEEDLLVAECYLNAGLTHSATLLRLVEDCLAHARCPFSAVDRLAVSVGPGSYTGLRIGMAAIKGLATPRNLPCVGVSTLEALAYNLLPCNGTVCAVLDARVGQVFTALFRVENGSVTRLTEDAAISLAALREMLPHGSIVCGDGTALVLRTFGEEKGLRAAPTTLQFQRASSVAIASLGRPAVSGRELEVAYHRLSQAERERAAKQENQ